MSSINPVPGAWLSAGIWEYHIHRAISHPSCLLSNNEFTAAMCKRNTSSNALIPIFNGHGTSDNNQNYQWSCDTSPKMIDQFGCHITSCKKVAHAIRLHDNNVHKLVILLCLLGLSVALEPLNLFSNLDPDANRRLSILIRNPRGGGRQITHHHPPLTTPPPLPLRRTYSTISNYKLWTKM